MSSIIGTGAAAVAAGVSARADGQGRTAEPVAPEFYVWRQFIVRNGTQPRRLADFLQNAAIPALNRLGRTTDWGLRGRRRRAVADGLHADPPRLGGRAGDAGDS